MYNLFNELWARTSGRQLKNASESFDGPLLRTNGGGVEIIEINPFMLRLSKHEYLFQQPATSDAARV